MEVEECVKEWEDLVADYKRLEVNICQLIFITHSCKDIKTL